MTFNPFTGTLDFKGSGGGSGDVTGPSSSVDSEISLFSGTGGKTIKRATGSGVVHATSGVYSASAVVEADITLADNTTNNVSTGNHGFAPKVTDTAKFLKGDGTWASPSTSVSAGDVMLLSQVFS